MGYLGQAVSARPKEILQYLLKVVSIYLMLYITSLKRRLCIRPDRVVTERYCYEKNPNGLVTLEMITLRGKKNEKKFTFGVPIPPSAIYPSQQGFVL